LFILYANGGVACRGGSRTAPTEKFFEKKQRWEKYTTTPEGKKRNLADLASLKNFKKE